MGLDMYLERMPRHGNTTPREISGIESYFDWKADKENPESNARKYTLKEWCGVDYKTLPPKHVRDFYKEHIQFGYADWDTEQQYTGRYRIIEQVAYWRKANAIHDWFVHNVQDGEDDCNYHDEVTKEILEELLDTCEIVLTNSKLVEGKVANGYHYNDSYEKVYNYVEGKYIEDPSVAKELLPTTSGFFFGSTDYDEYYYEDIEYTANKIREILETTDFETQMIYYISSW